MEAARDLVRGLLAAELAARVELRQHDRQGGHALVGHLVDGDPRAVVDHRHRAVRMDGQLDRVGAPGEGLVDSVVDHLEDELVEPTDARRADVHARPQPDWLEALENGDVLGGIGSFSWQKIPASSTFLGYSYSIRPSGRNRPSRGWLAQLFPLFCEVLLSRSRRPTSGRRAPAPRWARQGVLSGPRRHPAGGSGRRSRSELQPGRRGLAERLLEAREDLALEMPELEGPGGRAGRDEQRPVACEAGRPRVHGDLLSDDAWPRRDEVCHRAGGPEPAQLAPDRLADFLHHAASALLTPSRPWVTSIV